MQVIAKAPANEQLRVWIEGEDLNGKMVKRGVLLPLTEPGPAAERLGRFGVQLAPAGDKIDVVSVKFRSKAAKAGFEAEQQIIALEVEADRPSPDWIQIPTLAVLGLIVFLQRRRLVPEPPHKPAIV
jgi:hypothetical protein